VPIKTDNSYLRDKVDLRINHLPAGDVRVLDCYSGKGLIWAAVQKVSGRKMKVLPIDQRKDKLDFHLHGDNLDYLETLDLAKFNVIDLDSYGIPFAQIECLARRKYKGVVFVTVIQCYSPTGGGTIPRGMLQKIGFTDAMITKAPTLFGRRGWQYFLEYLSAIGVKKIHHRSHARKHYLAMALAG
jgi:hypothetical protein